MAKVLVIDDHRDVAEVMRQLFGAKGHEVRCCASAEDGLELVKVGGFDAVIVDQRLPGMRGLDFTKRMRVDEAVERRGRSETYIVVWSADDHLEREAMEAGASEFWVKGGQDLFDRVDRLIERLGDADGV